MTLSSQLSNLPSSGSSGSGSAGQPAHSRYNSLCRSTAKKRALDWYIKIKYNDFNLGFVKGTCSTMEPTIKIWDHVFFFSYFSLSLCVTQLLSWATS